MIHVPDQLVNARFVKTRQDKRPYEKGWQDHGYPITDASLVSSVVENDTYGVLCGEPSENLVVIDFDDASFQERMFSNLPETFTVKSAGRGLLHLYYHVDDPRSGKVLDENKNTLADVQGRGKQVIGPGSKNRETGRVYEIVRDLPITRTTMDTLERVLGVHQKKQKAVTKGGVVDQIKATITISSLLSRAGVDISKNPTGCPFHASVGGKCLSFNDATGLWHCFHCDEGGDVFTLQQKLGGGGFKDALATLAPMVGLEPTITRRAPPSTPTPAPGLEYVYVQTTGTDGDWCKCRDAIGSWYQRDVAMELESLLYKTTPEASKHRVTEAIGHLRAQRWIPISEFQPDPNVIHFNNGVYLVDKRTFVPRDGTADMSVLAGYNIKTFSVVPHDYDPAAPAVPEWDAFLALVFDQATIERWYEWLGYLLTSSVARKKAAMYIGDHNSGKSTIARVQFYILGEDRVTRESFHSLCLSPFSTFPLVGKHVCYDDDLGNARVQFFERFKKLTGDSVFQVNPKGKNQYEAPNTCKIQVAVNLQLPEVANMDESFATRWIFFQFRHQFPKESRDLGFEERMKNTAVAQHVIKNAVAGLERLATRNFFSGMSDEDVLKYWRQNTDLVYRFVTERCERGTGLQTEKDTLYEAFVEFAEDVRWTREIPTKNALTTGLATMGIHVMVTRNDGKQTRVYRGVQVKPFDDVKNGKNDATTSADPNLSIDDRIRGMSILSDEAPELMYKHYCALFGVTGTTEFYNALDRVKNSGE